MKLLDLFGFLPFTVVDVVDIVLVSFLLYKLYLLVRGTVAIRVLMGVLAFYVFWLVVKALKMHAMSEIFRQVINVGVIALIVVFQQEIRKFLVNVGNSDFFRLLGSKKREAAEEELSLPVQPLCDAVFSMAKSHTGALIAIERKADCQQLADTGKRVMAEVSEHLLESIFFKNSPLHDGAVLIRAGTVVAASCTLPLSTNKRLPDHYGMRHRAAIGITEELDALVVVVSEESGEVSLVADGEVHPVKGKPQFKAELKKLLAQ